MPRSVPKNILTFEINGLKINLELDIIIIIDIAVPKTIDSIRFLMFSFI